MPVYLGTAAPGAVYAGTQPVTGIYAGTTLIWSPGLSGSWSNVVAGVSAWTTVATITIPAGATRSWALTIDFTFGASAAQTASATRQINVTNEHANGDFDFEGSSPVNTHTTGGWTSQTSVPARPLAAGTVITIYATGTAAQAASRTSSGTWRLVPQ